MEFLRKRVRRRWAGQSAVTIAGLSLAFIASLAMHGSVQAQDPSSGAFCPTPDSPPVVITQDSIAYLPVETSIGRLRELCPAAYESAYGDNFGHVVPALAFPFPDLLVKATQNSTTLVPGRSPDDWVITGGAAVLPRGVPITATWSTVRSTYTWLSVTSTSRKIGVSLCEFPMIGLDLADVDLGLTFETQSVDPKAIPGTTTIAAVWVAAGINRRVPTLCKTQTPPNKPMQQTALVF